MAAKGPWRRAVVVVLVESALVELGQEQVAAAEESVLEQVADTQDFFCGSLGSDAIQEGPSMVLQEGPSVVQ
jgi:hypothetical protein